MTLGIYLKLFLNNMAGTELPELQDINQLGRIFF